MGIALLVFASMLKHRILLWRITALRIATALWVAATLGIAASRRRIIALWWERRTPLT